MNKWHVERESGDCWDSIQAKTLNVDSGCLIFLGEQSEVVQSYAPGTWKTVTKDEEWVWREWLESHVVKTF